MKLSKSTGIALIISAGLMFGCQEKKKEEAPVVKQVEAVPVQKEAVKLEVIDFKAKVWPFTVDKGNLACIENVPVFLNKGETYALNKKGKDKFAALGELQKVDEANDGKKFPLNKMVKTAMSLCGTDTKQPVALKQSKKEKAAAEKAGKAEKVEIAKYETVLEALEEESPFSKKDKSLDILNNKPLHFMIHPDVDDDDDEKAIMNEVKKSIVVSLLNVFIHTGEDEAQVTSVPEQDGNLLKQYNTSVSVKKEKMKKLVEKHAKVKGLKDLKEENKKGDLVWSAAAKNIITPKGKPGLDAFYAALSGEKPEKSKDAKKKAKK